ncbi:multicopper oxidase [Ramaria rubella]|nr:multicopper oxidase [Ramaria rubella]
MARTRPLLLAVTAISLLALVLGLGLGLGLRHTHTRTPDPSPSPNPASTFPSLSAQSSANFVLDKLDGQPPETRVYNFTVAQVVGAPDGVQREMLVVNGLYPGPTIQANQGDRLVVHVQNNLPNATSIHWHGLVYQNGTNFYDGTSGITECGIPPGQSLTYNFTFGEFYGSTWWQLHAIHRRHHRCLVVHPTAPPPSSLPTWDDELVVQMADWYHDMSGGLLADYLSPEGIAGTQGNEPVPDGGMLNGIGQYGSVDTFTYSNFTLQRGKTYRIRLVNTGSFASVRFSIDGHPLTLIEADGTYLSPTPVASVILAVAQRYSVLVHANATGERVLLDARDRAERHVHVHPTRPAVSQATPASPDPGPGSDGLPDIDGTTALVPLVVDKAPDPTRAYGVSFGFEETDQGLWLAFMNTHGACRAPWAPLTGLTTLMEAQRNPMGYAAQGGSIAAGDQFMVMEDEVMGLQLQIDNLDDGDHPFHLHGHRPWIMGSGLGRYTGQAVNNTNPLRRDTVLIPAYSWMVLRFVTDNPGLWAFHCHLAWHMAAGLLMQFSSLPSKVAQMELPADIVAHCQADAGSGSGSG